MALALDGHATGSWSSGTTITATLTTTNTNDVIVAVVGTVGNVTITVTSISATGVTWNGSARKTLAFSSHGDLEIWYGTAAANLSAVTITVNLSGSTLSAGNVNVFGVSGANTGSISDANASLPATGTGASGTAPTVTGVSTSNANDMIIGGCGIAGNTTETAGTNFTLIDGAGHNNESTANEYQVVSATQSSISVAFGTAAVGGNWGMIVDAIKAGVTDTLMAQACF